MLNRIDTTTNHLEGIDTTNWNILADKRTTQNLQDYLQMKINMALREGYKKGQEDFKDNIKKIIQTEMNQYIGLTTIIAESVHSKIKETFKEDIKILDTRTNFFFGYQKIKILLIIECNNKIELDFIKVLQDIEIDTLRKNNFYCEILYINKKEIELNLTSIEIDFPLSKTNKK
jgi:hypothetical protein